MKIKKIAVLAAVLMLSGMITGCGDSKKKSSLSITQSKSTEFNVSELIPDNWEDCLTYELKYDHEVEITDCSSSAAYIVIPDTIEGYPVTSIARKAFSDCKKLKAVEIGKNVEHIGVDAFEHSGLEYVTIPDSVTKIAQYAFAYTPLYNRYEEGIIYIDGWAVGYASKESEMIFENGTRGISFMAFAKCDFLNTVVIPSAAIINDCAFMNCINLTSLTFGDDVGIIGSQAFDGCSSLNKINFGNGITEINSKAFNGCYNLAEVTLPEKVEDIYQEAFNGCNQLKSITFESTDCKISDPTQEGDTIPSGTLVRGYWGSTAEKYAEDWFLNFEGIGGGNRGNSSLAENAFFVTDVSLGDKYSAVITDDESLYMWGSNSSGNMGNLIEDDTKIPCKIMNNVKNVFTGRNSTAAISKDGVLYVWGFNDNNQLGVSKGKVAGYVDVRYYPSEIMEGVKIKDVAIGSSYGAAVTEDGIVYQWGNGKIEPISVSGLSGIKLISAGDYHFAALAEDGSLYTWGRNNIGQLGNGEFSDNRTTFYLTPVKMMDKVVSVSCGSDFTAAVTEDGILYTWGSNQFGQLGDGTTNSSNVPIKIMDDVKSVSAIGAKLMTLKKSGEVYVFEQDSSIKGNSSVVSVEIYGSYPVKVMDNAVSISCGNGHYAAVDANGNLYTWGSNNSGELGDGTKEDSEAPVPIYITSDNPENISE